VTAPVFRADVAAISVGAVVELAGPEGRHAATVMRLQPGEALVLTDGAGRAVRGVVRETGRDHLWVEALEVEPVAAPSPRLVVVQALVKGDRGERAVEMLTEVGADVVVPWAAAHSVAKWTADRQPRALERWRSTARESAKQSRRVWWPEIAEPASTDAVVELIRGSATAVVLHEEATVPLSRVEPPASGDLVLVVGPEGGLAAEEIAAFAGAGATVCRLGPTVLRTSTAGTVAAAVLLSATGRWS
jgi:16S rRNA (uracil1498-N3)-methyltransferase